MTTPLLAALIGGYARLFIVMGLAWMAFWIWIYFKAPNGGRE
jgi:hypothetical protein